MNAPLLFLLINSTASNGCIPSSIKAIATKAGALPNPATQWTAIVGDVSFVFDPRSSRSTRVNHSATTLGGGYKKKRYEYKKIYT